VICSKYFGKTIARRQVGIGKEAFTIKSKSIKEGWLHNARERSISESMLCYQQINFFKQNPKAWAEYELLGI